MNPNSAQGWSGVQTFAALMKDSTSFTAADVLTALGKVTSANPIDSGMFGPFIGSGTSPLSKYPRLLNSVYTEGQVKDGQIVAIKDGFQKTDFSG